jgi:hypothetical protein
MAQIQMATAYHGLEINETNIKEFNGPRWAWRATKQIQRHKFFVRAAGSEAERCGMETHNEESETSAHVGNSVLDNWVQGAVEQGDDYVICRSRWANRRELRWGLALEHAWRAAMVWAECSGELEFREREMVGADG